VVEKSGSETSGWMTPFGIDAVIEMQRPALTAMADANNRLFESIAAVNKEWASFVNRRLKEELAVPQQLAQCKTLEDLYRVYAQFFQNAFEQYRSGLEQMTKLSQSLAENALQSLQSRSDETIRTRH
jgi:Phasin protein